MAVSLQRYIQEQEIIHLIGIGGVSMSSLAELLLSQGVHVTGSDRQESAVTERLERLGARITYAHLPENVDGAALVIRTAAVHDDNFEVIRARERGIPVIERAEAWGALMADYDNVVCLAGTHGKTTSTSMMTMIALEAGLDPTVMVGSHLPAIGGTLRIGGHGCFIAESCEYCNSFLSFRPTIAVVLNVEEDHLDFFKDIDDILNSFHEFAKLIPSDGTLIINGEIPGADIILKDLSCKVVTFGSTSEYDYHPEQITYDENGNAGFLLVTKNSREAVTLGVPGLHNVYNAIAAFAVADLLSVDFSVARSALTDFHGTERRFEYKGMMNGTTIIDDYAHHPTEITATLAAAINYPRKSLWCVFQPHTYTRTKALMKDFAKALSVADYVVLADIYPARETDDLGISSRNLLEEIKPLNKNCYYFSSFKEIENFLYENCQPGDLLITMGAGNVVNIGENLLDR